jgi:hypothetical protein
MQKNRISPLMMLAFVLAVALMAAVGWWLSSPSAPAPVVVAQKQTKVEPPKSADSTKPSIAPVSPTPGTAEPTAPQPVDPANMTPANVAADQAAREAADMKIGTILAQTNGVEATRDKLLLLFPGMNNYEKIAAAPHLVNLVMDPELPRLLPYLMANTTPVEAQETIFNDMLNRPPQIGWPVLVNIASNPKHPFSERAKELLTTIVGEDYGNDIFAWRRGIQAQMERQGIEFDANGNPIPDNAAATTSATGK